MIKTPTEQETQEKIKTEIERLTEQINKIQRKIDKTAVKTWLLRELVKARDALILQRNEKINLYNIIS